MNSVISAYLRLVSILLLAIAIASLLGGMKPFG